MSWFSSGNVLGIVYYLYADVKMINGYDYEPLGYNETPL